MSDGIKTTLIMSVKPELADTYGETFARLVPDTLAFPGCRRVECYRNMEQPDQFIIIGEWDSKPAYEAYLAWRRSIAEAKPPEPARHGAPKIDFWSPV